MTNLMPNAIKALILDQFSSDYPASSIFQGYPNNDVRPQNNQFVVMTLLPTNSMMLNPVVQYDSTTEETSYQNINTADWQVDFYGSPAQADAIQFKLLLEVLYANDFFNINDYGCSVHTVRQMPNLTQTIDSQMYIPRYAVLFSLFYNNIVTVSEPGFDTATPEIYFEG